MSTLAWVLFALLVAWHSIVTIVLLVVLRQVTVLSAQTGVGVARREEPLAVGQLVSEALVEAAPSMREQGVVYYVAWLTGSCMACREFADAIVLSQRDDTFPDPIIALVTGSEAGAQRIIGQLSGALDIVIEDPLASTVVSELGLDSTPFALQVERGVITGWVGIRSMEDLFQLRNARSSSDADEWVAAAMSAKASNTGRE